MAAPAQQAINRVSQTSSRSQSSSNKGSTSFSSWGRRKPRDSLERMRQRQSSMAQTPPVQRAHHRLLTSVRNFSAHILREEEEEEDEESDVDSILPVTFRPPINRSVVCDRYPKGRASLLVFILNVIVSYAFGAAVTGILNIFRTEHHTKDVHFYLLLHLLFQNCVSRMFYPLAGFIADVYIGRYRTIKIAICLLFIGYVILVVLFVLEGQNIHLKHRPFGIINAFRLISFLIISAGGGAFEATVIPFGVDQLPGASSAEISSYFHFFYFGRNLGMICGIFMYCVVYSVTLKVDSLSTETQKLTRLYSSFQPLVTVVILTIGLLLNLCLNHWYFKNVLWENPVKLVAKVLKYAATVKRHLPVHRRAFRYGEEKKKRIDLAKVEYDGKFPAEKVEDVKVFCRICLLMFTLMPTFSSVTAFNEIISFEANKTLAEYHPCTLLKVDFYPNVFFVVNALLVLLSLPIINYGIIPCLPKLTIRARIGAGLTLYCIGNIALVAIHAGALVHSHWRYVSMVQLFCLLLPMVIFAFAESLTIVSTLEFIYAQSPESMKGLLTGLFFLFVGISSIASSAVFYVYPKSLENKNLVPFYATFTVIQMIGLVFYVIVATLHKNRLRPYGDSFSHQQLIIEDQLN